MDRNYEIKLNSAAVVAHAFKRFGWLCKKFCGGVEKSAQSEIPLSFTDGV